MMKYAKSKLLRTKPHMMPKESSKYQKKVYSHIEYKAYSSARIEKDSRDVGQDP